MCINNSIYPKSVDFRFPGTFISFAEYLLHENSIRENEIYTFWIRMSELYVHAL